MSCWLAVVRCAARVLSTSIPMCKPVEVQVEVRCLALGPLISTHASIQLFSHSLYDFHFALSLHTARFDSHARYRSSLRHTNGLHPLRSGRKSPTPCKCPWTPFRRIVGHRAGEDRRTLRSHRGGRSSRTSGWMRRAPRPGVHTPVGRRASSGERTALSLPSLHPTPRSRRVAVCRRCDRPHVPAQPRARLRPPARRPSAARLAFAPWAAAGVQERRAWFRAANRGLSWSTKRGEPDRERGLGPRFGRRERSRGVPPPRRLRLRPFGRRL